MTAQAPDDTFTRRVCAVLLADVTGFGTLGFAELCTNQEKLA